MKRTELRERTVDQLSIDDERSFRDVPLYADLKEVLRRDRYPFRVLPAGSTPRWDRALFLNLTFWGAAGGDVLEGLHLPADVVAHAAWHHLARWALSGVAGISAEALFLGESVATAFDVYLVGRLLRHAPRSAFLQTQVPAMAEAAKATGLTAARFEKLLREMAAEPERSFAELRELLFDATTALVACDGVDGALTTLDRFASHRFASLLHHYELSNWVLYARAHASAALGPDPRVRAVDRALRRAPVPLEWLTSHWVEPALDASPQPRKGDRRARKPSESGARRAARALNRRGSR